MRNEIDVRNYQASIKLLMERSKGEEYAFYLGIYNALEWVCNDKEAPTKLHYKMAKIKRA